MDILKKYKENLTDTLDQKWLFHIVKKNFFSIPISVRIISLSSFLFILWRWLGADTFFSLYIKSIIDNIFWVSVIWWWLSFIRMFFTIPIGKLNDHVNMKSIIFLSKFFYVIAGLLYFFAGTFASLTILIIAVVFNWFASATIFTTYNSYIRHWINKNKSWAAFGLFFSSFNFAYVVGALISATFIGFLDLKYVFLFVSLFAAISFFTDRHLPEVRQKKKLDIFSKKNFLKQFFSEAFSWKSFVETWNDMKIVKKEVVSWLKFEFLFGVLNYIWFLFIPIICFQDNLSFAHIAIVFAVMRLPYVIDLVLGWIADKYNKRWFIMTVLVFVSLLYVALAYTTSFGGIITISFGISFGLAIIRPIISAMTSQQWNMKIVGSITWAEQFVGRVGDVVGAIWFGILSMLFSVKIAFILIGILIFIRSFGFLFRNFVLKKIIRKSK